MYLDPGFGGLLLQAIFAIAAVGGGILYSFRRKLRNLFKKDEGKPEVSVESVTESDADEIDMMPTDKE